jgi:hypothetical protein
MAKRWPDEQEADMRRRTGVRWPNSSKPETCTESVRRISDRHKRESGCAIPGEIWQCAEREAERLPTSRGDGTHRQKSADGIVGSGQGAEPTRVTTEGPNKWKRE